VLILGERDHAVADVAGREHIEVLAETAGGTSVVGNGDDGGEIADEAGKGGRDPLGAAARQEWGCGFRVVYAGGRVAGAARVGLGAGDVRGAASGGGSRDISFEAAQQGREACASADRDDAQGGRSGLRGGRHCLGKCKW
jgi:hypothetical protein